MRWGGLGLIVFLASPAAAAEHWRCHEGNDWIDYLVGDENLSSYHNDVILTYRISYSSRRLVLAVLDNVSKHVVQIDKRTGKLSTAYDNSRKLTPSGSCSLTDGPIQQSGPPSR